VVVHFCGVNIYAVLNFYTIQLRNTYQAVMATDGVMSFVFFIYVDLQWRGSSTFIGFCGHTSSPQCSCTVSNRIFPLTFTGCTTNNDILNLRSGSNVDTPGVYAYRVDGQEILRPVGECSTVTLSLSAISSIA